jgi:hypothetical protein
MAGVLRAFALLGIAALLIIPGVAFADPCLIVYPDGVAVYHYDPAEYYTVTMGDPLYDAMYDRGGEVLIDSNTNEIAYDIYQAPGLAGFEEDAENQGVYTMEQDFTLIVDGFSNAPTTYTNVLLVFDLISPDGCTPVILIDGNAPLYDAGLGYYYPVGDLSVSTPASGGNYSDVLSFDFSWTGCNSIRIWAFADDNYNLVRDGGECFSAFSHDLTVPTQTKSWGELKSEYR